MNKPYLFIVADSNEQGSINAGCLSSARKMPITKALYAAHLALTVPAPLISIVHKHVERDPRTIERDGCI